MHFSLTALGCSIACLLAGGLSLPSLMTEVAQHLHQFFHLEKYVVASQRASLCVYLHLVYAIIVATPNGTPLPVLPKQEGLDTT